MLTTLAIILLIVWVLGFSLGWLGAWIHLALVVSIVLILARLIKGEDFSDDY